MLPSEFCSTVQVLEGLSYVKFKLFSASFKGLRVYIKIIFSDLGSLFFPNSVEGLRSGSLYTYGLCMYNVHK